MFHVKHPKWTAFKISIPPEKRIAVLGAKQASFNLGQGLLGSG
jgi:hypothetical protein